MREWGLTPPQWRALSEDDREEMLEESRLVCPRCGNLREVCSDPARDWFPQRDVCHASAELALVHRRLSMGHKAPGWEPHPMDGVSVWVSDVDYSPDDDFIPARPAKS